MLGGAFALSWTPCVGPVLAAVLALASSRGGAAEAALLLGAYAAGLAVPLIASAVAFDRALGAASFLRDRYDVIRVVSGLVLIALGLLVFFDRIWWLSVAVNRVLRAVGLDALATSPTPGTLRSMAVIHVHGADLMMYSRVETQLAPLGHRVLRARPGLEGEPRTSASAMWSASRPSRRWPICARRSSSDSARTSSRTRCGPLARRASTGSSRARRSRSGARRWSTT